MSNLAYDVVELEEASIDEMGTERAKPFIVPSGGSNDGDPAGRRSAEILDWELARGSMPA